MKLITGLGFLLLSLNVMASGVCYKAVKQGDEVGQICLSKSLTNIEVADSVQVTGQIENLQMNFTFVRLQDQQAGGCAKPKDRPPICHYFSEAVFKLPHPPLNSVGLPSVPSDLTFAYPDFSKGEAWGYDLVLIND